MTLYCDKRLVLASAGDAWEGGEIWERYLWSIIIDVTFQNLDASGTTLGYLKALFPA